MQKLIVRHHHYFRLCKTCDGSAISSNIHITISLHFVLLLTTYRQQLRYCNAIEKSAEPIPRTSNQDVYSSPTTTSVSQRARLQLSTTVWRIWHQIHQINHPLSGRLICRRRIYGCREPDDGPYFQYRLPQHSAPRLHHLQR